MIEIGSVSQEILTSNKVHNYQHNYNQSQNEHCFFPFDAPNCFKLINWAHLNNKLYSASTLLCKWTSLWCLSYLKTSVHNFLKQTLYNYRRRWIITGQRMERYDCTEENFHVGRGKTAAKRENKCLTKPTPATQHLVVSQHITSTTTLFIGRTRMNEYNYTHSRSHIVVCLGYWTMLEHRCGGCLVWLGPYVSVSIYYLN